MMPYLATVANAAGLGFGAGGAFFMVRWVAIFVAGRWDKKEAHLDAGTDRLIRGLEVQIDSLTNRITSLNTRLDHVESELSECKRLHAESEAERTRLNAVLQGMGDARQHAQLIVSAERAKQSGEKDK